MIDQLINDRAGLFRPGWIAMASVYGVEGGTASGKGMGADDLPCSRNARPEKALVERAQWKISQPPSLEKITSELGGAISIFRRAQ